MALYGGLALRECVGSAVTAVCQPPNRQAKLPLLRHPCRRLGRTLPQWERIPPTVQRIIRELINGQVRWPLYLWGEAGTGKTMAAYWVASRVFDSCVVDLETLAEEVFHREATVWRRLADPDLRLAVIDEIGLRSQQTDREYLALKKAADRLEWTPTIWISNLAPEDLQQAFDDRIFSRLCCGTICHATGPDQRFSP